MTYAPDPGGNFASDAHRRILAHLTPDAMSVEDFAVRIAPDSSCDFSDDDEMVSVLEDLEADGYASKSQAGWKQTKKGLDALNAEVKEG